MQRTKKALSLFLTLVMVFTMLPAVALTFAPKAQAATAYPTYTKTYDTEYYYPFGTQFIYQLAVSSHSKQATAQNNLASAGFTQFGVDFNVGAGGNYIYAGYTTTTDPVQACKAVVVWDETESPNGFNYYVDQPFNGANCTFYEVGSGFSALTPEVASNIVNLNEGCASGSHRQYLFVTADRGAGFPITELTMASGQDGTGGDLYRVFVDLTEAGYTVVRSFQSNTPEDLNEGAKSGHANVYLGYKTAESLCSAVDSDRLRAAYAAANDCYANGGTIYAGLGTPLSAASAILADLADGYTTSSQDAIDAATLALWEAMPAMSLNTAVTLTAPNSAARRWLKFVAPASGSNTYVFFSCAASGNPKASLYPQDGPYGLDPENDTPYATNDDVDDLIGRIVGIGSKQFYFGSRYTLYQNKAVYLCVEFPAGNAGSYPIKVCKTQSITFYSTGGGDSVCKEFPVGHGIHLDQTGITRGGHTLVGWSATADGYQDVHCKASELYTVTESVNQLYARWSPNSPTALALNTDYTATIGGRGKAEYYLFTPTVTADYVLYSVNNTKKTCATLSHWADYPSTAGRIGGANGNGAAALGQTNKDFCLKARLTAGTSYLFGVKFDSYSDWGYINFRLERCYTVSFNANGGTGGAQSATKFLGRDLDLSGLTAPTRQYYTFLGWSANSAAAEPTYAASGGVYTADADATLYAIWQRKPCTVTLDDNCGGGYVNSVTVTYGEPLPLINNVPTREGYRLEGFYDTSDGSGGRQYYDATGICVRYWDKEGTSGTLYARWTPLTEILTVDLSLNRQPTPGGSPSGIEAQSDNAGFSISHLVWYRDEKLITDTFPCGDVTCETLLDSSAGYWFPSDVYVTVAGAQSVSVSWNPGCLYIFATYNLPHDYSDWRQMTQEETEAAILAGAIHDQTGVVWDVRTCKYCGCEDFRCVATCDVNFVFNRNDAALPPIAIKQYSVLTPEDLPTPPPVDGGRFEGWYTDRTYRQPLTNIAVDDALTLYGKYAEADNPTVSFAFNEEGLSLDESEVYYGSVLTEALLPSAPQAEGLTFFGWYTDDNYQHPIEEGVTVSGDVVLYGLYLPGVVRLYIGRNAAPASEEPQFCFFKAETAGMYRFHFQDQDPDDWEILSGGHADLALTEYTFIELAAGESLRLRAQPHTEAAAIRIEKLLQPVTEVSVKVDPTPSAFLKVDEIELLGNYALIDDINPVEWYQRDILQSAYTLLADNETFSPCAGVKAVFTVDTYGYFTEDVAVTVTGAKSVEKKRNADGSLTVTAYYDTHDFNWQAYEPEHAVAGLEYQRGKCSLCGKEDTRKLPVHTLTLVNLFPMGITQDPEEFRFVGDDVLSGDDLEQLAGSCPLNGDVAVMFRTKGFYLDAACTRPVDYGNLLALTKSCTVYRLNEMNHDLYVGRNNIRHTNEPWCGFNLTADKAGRYRITIDYSSEADFFVNDLSSPADTGESIYYEIDLAADETAYFALQYDGNYDFVAVVERLEPIHTATLRFSLPDHCLGIHTLDVSPADGCILDYTTNLTEEEVVSYGVSCYAGRYTCTITPADGYYFADGFNVKILGSPDNNFQVVDNDEIHITLNVYLDAHDIYCSHRDVSWEFVEAADYELPDSDRGQWQSCKCPKCGKRAFRFLPDTYTLSFVFPTPALSMEPVTGLEYGASMMDAMLDTNLVSYVYGQDAYSYGGVFTDAAHTRKLTDNDVMTSDRSVYVLMNANPLDVSLSWTEKPYNGATQKPDVTVLYDVGFAQYDCTDYTLSWSGGCKYPGTYTVTVTAANGCTAQKTFTITEQSLDPANVTLSWTSAAYNGSVQKPTVTVKNAAGSKLTLNTSYTVAYSADSKLPGSYTVSVTGKGNYEGTATVDYTITKQTLTADNVTLSWTAAEYNGAAQKPAVTVKNAAGSALTKNVSYTVSYSTGSKYPGTYTVTVTGKGNYDGTVSLRYTIAKQTLTADNIALSWTEAAYSAAVQQPAITVTNAAGKILALDGSYTVTWPDGCKLPGTYTVKVTGKGYYKGSVEKTFTITKQTLAAENITLSWSSREYNGSIQKPTVTVKNAAGSKLTLNASYTVAYSADSKYPGTYTVTVTGKGNYSGSVSKTYAITKATLTPANMTLSWTQKEFNGSVQKPTLTVKNAAGTVLTLDGSYTVTWPDGCKLPGIYTVKATGKGYYTGTAEKTFTIKKQALAAARVTLSWTEKEYNGSVQKPTVTVKNAAGTKLTLNTSYTVSWSADSKYPGTYTVTVAGKGNYSGSVQKTYTIANQTLTAANVTLSPASFNYNGSVQKPTVTVKAAQGTTLTEGGSYTVTWPSGCKAKGTYNVTITGKGYYTGTVTVSYTIQ